MNRVLGNGLVIKTIGKGAGGLANGLISYYGMKENESLEEHRDDFDKNNRENYNEAKDKKMMIMNLAIIIGIFW